MQVVFTLISELDKNGLLEKGLIKLPAYSGLFMNRYSLNTSLNLFTMLETASLLLELETNVRSSGRKLISCLE